MKIELGKTKIRGFKFKHLTEGVVWDRRMENYIEKEGVIMSIHHEHIYQSMRVKFDDGNSYAYPLEMAKQYIIENNMKNLKITPPDGYEIDKEKSTFENIVFKPIKKELPKSWGELGRIGGFYAVSSNSDVEDIENEPSHQYHKNVFATKEQAEASLALAQLSQLREVYRDGWKPYYNGTGQIKYVIYYERNRTQVNTAYDIHAFLSFQSAEVRDLFLKNFRDLIEQAKPLMS